MGTKAQCLKCKNRLNVADWKEGETQSCPVCNYLLTVSPPRDTELFLLVGELVLLWLEYRGLILMYMLGVICPKSEVVRDYRKAVSWFCKAAEKENTKAMLTLGLMYHKGRGVPQDYVEAYVWFSVAAAFGHRNADASRRTSASKLTPSEKMSAQSRGSELFNKIKKRLAV